MKSQGWHRKFLFLMVVSALTYSSVFASSLTIREITLKGNNEVEIQFDSPVSKKMLELDYVRDIAQLSITNSTIYPAKILHAEKQSFNKVFAYQYAPNLVRVRFSVEGIAGQFQGRVETQISGNRLTIRFPQVTAASAGAISEDAENALLAKIEKSEKSEKADSVPEKSNNSDRSSEKAEKSLTGKKTTSMLGGVKAGPSVLRSMLAMLLIVGGLGAVLVWIKRKKNAAQATKVGGKWYSNFLPQGMRKQKSFIEIIAQHALGPKQSITVVKIRGQQFVLGVTQDSVQLITQIDADETEVDLLEDPAVAASLGKMFGSAPQKAEKSTLGSTFANLLKSTVNTGKAAVNAPAKPPASTSTANIRPLENSIQIPATPAVAITRGIAHAPVNPNSGIRDQIRKRLEGARS